MSKLLTPQEALQAIIDGKSLEYKWCGTGDWRHFNRFNNGVSIEAILRSSCIFRLLREMVIVGGVSFPKPVSKALEEGQGYYLPDLTVTRLYYISQWHDTEVDKLRLKRGLVHLTEENAIAHAKALIKLSGGNVDE